MGKGHHHRKTHPAGSHSLEAPPAPICIRALGCLHQGVQPSPTANKGGPDSLWLFHSASGNPTETVLGPTRESCWVSGRQSVHLHLMCHLPLQTTSACGGGWGGGPVRMLGGIPPVFISTQASADCPPSSNPQMTVPGQRTPPFTPQQDQGSEEEADTRPQGDSQLAPRSARGNPSPRSICWGKATQQAERFTLKKKGSCSGDEGPRAQLRTCGPVLAPSVLGRSDVVANKSGAARINIVHIVQIYKYKCCRTTRPPAKMQAGCEEG